MNYSDAITNKTISLSLEQILSEAVIRKCICQVQYSDYNLDTWTVPLHINEAEVSKLLNDGSVRKIRLEFEV